MKANLSKILTVMLAACFCMNFVSCKKDKDEPEAAGTKSMTGIWRLYEYENGQRAATDTYFRIKDDYTADLFGKGGTMAKPEYAFFPGTYTTENGWFVISYTSRNYYTQDSVVRCNAEFKEKDEYRRYSNFYITSNSGTEIEAELQNRKVCLVKSSMPSYWRSEYSEYAVTPTIEGVISQWDLVSCYELNGDSYQAWFHNAPEQAGITFVSNDQLGKCPFWANEVWTLENKAGRVGNKDGVSLHSTDCAWTLAGRTLTMTCSAYERIQYDASGTETSRQKVTPSTPIERTYNVYTLSDSWLTLYSTISLRYYSFFRHSTTPSSAPAAAPACSSAKKSSIPWISCLDSCPDEDI